jgi:hypothetical protein
MNPDGVYLGYTRSTLQVADQNRVWNPTDFNDSIVSSVRAKIVSLNTTEELDLLYDLHGLLSDTTSQNYIYSVPSSTPATYLMSNMSKYTFWDTSSTPATSCSLGTCTARGWGITNGYFGFFTLEIQTSNSSYTKNTYDLEGRNITYAIDEYFYNRPVTDTCTCPGSSTNWAIDMSDYCTVSSYCLAGNLTFTGTGNLTINTGITLNISRMGTLASNSQYYLHDNSKIILRG